MTKPIVAIIGRPNVGKSTFFNRMIRDKVAIIDDTPGVTRDRIFGDADWLSYSFTLIDTGGIEPVSEDIILQQMKRQAQLAIEAADAILFFVDAKDGIVPADFEVANMLRAADKPVIVVVNKSESDMNAMYDFYALGIGEVFAISAEQGLGLGDMLDELIKHIEKFEQDENDENRPIKVAILGKPNAGKSSLANKILGFERTIVSEVAGTTRDAIDTPVEIDGKQYVIIDTAGIRKKARIEDKSIERYSVIRSLMAVRRADVCLIMIDALDGITEQDVKIAGYVHEEGKCCVVCVNKWDLIEKDTYTELKFNKDIEADLAFMSYVPKIYISAKTGQRVQKVFSLVEKVHSNSSRRVTTGLLNDCIREAVTAVEPPSDKGRRLKLFYVSQVAIAPPTFVIFVNDPLLLHFSYRRYLENYLRKSFDFSGTPIKIIVRERNEKEE